MKTIFVAFAFAAFLPIRLFANSASDTGPAGGQQPSTANPVPVPPKCPKRDCPPLDPVVLSGGKFYYPAQDVQIPGLGRAFGMNLHFSRGYSNRDNAVGVLGKGWCSTLDVYLGNSGGSVPFLRHETGRLIYFTSGYITFPDGHSGSGWQDSGFTLEAVTGGDYEMITLEGIKYRFTSVGQLRYMEDPLGHRLTYNHNVLGQTTSITDASSRSLTFTYNGAGRLDSMKDPLGRTWGYGYLTGAGLFGENMLSAVAGPAPLGLTEQYYYDGGGNMVSVKSPRGYVTSYTYDTTLDRVTRMTHPDGTHVDFTYNNFLGTSAMTDEDGKIWQYEYVGQGQVSNVIDPLNAVHHYLYNSANELTEYQGPLYDPVTAPNRKITYTWSNHNMTHVTDETGANRDFTWDPNNHEMLSETDDNSHTVTITRDPWRRVANLQDARGKNIVCTYDPSTGLTKTITDRRGKVTTFNYDAYGNATSIVDASSQTWSTTFDAACRPVTRTNPLSQSVTYTYDAANRVTRVTDAAGKFWDYTYDPDGNLLTQKTPLASTTTIYTYDSRNRRLTAKDPLNNTTTWTYNGRSLVTSVKDPLNQVTTNDYDAVGRIIKTTQPPAAIGGIAIVTEYTYNLAGEMTSLKDAKGQITQHAWDPTIRRLTRTFQDASTELSDFDGVGNLTGFTNRSGQLATRTYNANNWQVMQNCPTCGATFDYDDEGNLIQAVDAAAGTYSWTYNNLNRVLTSVQPSGVTGASKTVGYTYDNAGRIYTLTYPDGTVVTYGYDATGRMTSLSPSATGGGGTYSFVYDNAGRRTSLSFPDGTAGSYGYDNASRLTSLAWNTSAAALLNSQSYVFDAASNITSATASNGLSGSRSYTYDQLNRLTSRSTSGSLHTPYGANFYWNLDTVGNRTSTSWGGTPSTYTLNTTNLNQYASAAGWSQTYDTRGNLTSDGVCTMSYDADNRLTQASKSGNTVNYLYDFAHRLAKRSVGASSTRYIYDQNWNVLADLNASGATIKLYLRGPSVDETVAEVSSSGTVVDCLLKDHLGSTTALYRIGIGVTQRYTYEEFGAVMVRDSAGNPLAGTPVPATRYLFTGREYDITTGLYFYRHRWYHPGFGRFVSPDPIGFQGGDVNIFSYVRNNPLMSGDYLGLFPNSLQLNDAAAICGIAAGVAGIIAVVATAPVTVTAAGVTAGVLTIAGGAAWLAANHADPPPPSAPSLPPVNPCPVTQGPWGMMYYYKNMMQAFNDIFSF